MDFLQYLNDPTKNTFCEYDNAELFEKELTYQLNEFYEIGRFQKFDKVIYLNTLSEKFKLRQNQKNFETIHLKGSTLKNRINILGFNLRKYQGQKIILIVSSIADFVISINDEIAAKELHYFMINLLGKNSSYTVAMPMGNSSGHLGMTFQKKSQKSLKFIDGELIELYTRKEN